MSAPPQVQVIWEDASLLAVNKPAGLPTLPDGHDPQAPHLKSLLTEAYGPLWIVHRLDRGTSGVVILARSAAAHRALNNQFAQHSVIKTYHALVVGSPAWQEKTTRLPLRANVGHRHRTAVDAVKGKPAVTHFRLLEQLGAYSLLAAHPETGRTHQIRAHLAAEGLPIAADELYGGGEKIQIMPNGPSLERPGLHAWLLEVKHPLSGEALKLQAPYPQDLATVLTVLRQFSSSELYSFKRKRKNE